MSAASTSPARPAPAGLRVFPAWRLHPRYDTVGAEPGDTARAALATHFGVDGAFLQARDRDGREVDLASRVPVGTSPWELAVSTRPLPHGSGLFEAPWLRPAGEAGDDGPADLQPEAPASGRMNEAERRLAEGLSRLGLPRLGLSRLGWSQPGRSQLDLASLADAFPPVPPGYEVSPYRVFFAVAAILTPQTWDEIERLDAQVRTLAETLVERLRIHSPDALDFRLHLFVEQSADEECLRRLREHFAGTEGDRANGSDSPAFPGAVHGGWRRLVVHPFRDEADRLAQMAGLGRSLAVERQERDVLRRVQEALAPFSHRPGLGGGPLATQRHVILRSAEEALREAGELLLLEGLERRLARDPDEVSGASSGRARDLAHGILRGCGLLPRRQLGAGVLSEPLTQRWVERLRDERRGRFGRDVADLDRTSDGPLRDWLRATAEALGSSAAAPSPQASLPTDPLPEKTVDRLFRTAVVDVACGLRSEIERLLEREVFPDGVRPDLDLAQFFAALECLGAELAAYRSLGPADPEDLADAEGLGSIASWLVRRHAELTATLGDAARRVVAAGDPLFSRLRRWTSDQGMTYAAVERAMDALEAAWLERQIVGRFLRPADDPDLAGLLDFADEFLGRFAAFREELEATRRDAAREIEERRRAASLGALGPCLDDEHLLFERLGRAVDELPWTHAIQRATRDASGRLRDLFRLSPADFLVGLTDRLLPELSRPVASLAAEVPGGGLEDLLDGAIHELFVDSPVQPSGADGVPGALDHLTCLLAFASPTTLRQHPDLVDLLERRLHELPTVETPPPITILPSHLAPGLLLVRSVQGLTWEQLCL